MRKAWIEAALNGARSRALQPGIPDTIETIVAEGVACARAPGAGTGSRDHPASCSLRRVPDTGSFRLATKRNSL